MIAALPSLGRAACASMMRKAYNLRHSLDADDARESGTERGTENRDPGARSVAAEAGHVRPAIVGSPDTIAAYKPTDARPALQRGSP